MKIIIDIDEDLYNYMQTEGYDEHLDKRFDYQIRFAVKKGTPLPQNPTNGDVIKAMFNPYKIWEYEDSVRIYMTEEDFWKADYQMNYDPSWWNAPYGGENG